MSTAYQEPAGADVTLDELYQDPYPAFRWFREHDPVPWIPAAGRYLVTRHRDIVFVDTHPEMFSADEQGSLVTRVMGHNMLRKDGAAHDRDRRAAEPALRPRIVKEHWTPRFQQNADDLIDGFIENGSGDLFRDFAGPLSARNLAAIMGLRDVADQDLQTWSQALIDGAGNYADDPDVWARCEAASLGVDAAIDAVIPYLQANPDGSVISAMLHADEPLAPDEIRANVKVFIGGGLNEPRDAVGVAAWATLTHPEVRRAVEADPTLWRRVFEEAVRWIAPIGMYPRQTTQEVELGGRVLPAGARLGVCAGSANRDETVFERPDEFDIDRPPAPHVAFGGGPHFCLGTWAARAQVAQIALPTLFRRLRGLRLDEQDPVRLGGWVFRGVLNLPAVWDA
ncbi:cytochrome P450 [Nocardioides sp. DS6]|uniref:Cytochrome P450 n=1 Tax=Nocardioides eburneus TaxID=3231482 RepID=A0ABV3SZI2_9ACTN